jgi:pimeloyl-ACP methyl ester carboxylesterase
MTVAYPQGEPNMPTTARLGKLLLIALSAAVALMALSYWWCGLGELPLDDQARAKAPGKFVGLPDGKVHYRWDGPADGPVVVMVHGFSLPSCNWDHNVPALTAAGFHVLSLDNYGRGWSDRPEHDNDIGLFDRELLGTLDALGLKDPVRLVGVSMGGAISTVFVARHPERVSQLVLIAPAGEPTPLAPAARIARWPVLGDWVMRVLGKRGAEKNALGLVDTPELKAEILSCIEQSLAYRGSTESLLSTLRYYPLGGLAQIYEDAGKAKIPTLLLWGDADTTAPYDGAAKVVAAMPSARLVTFPGGGHGINKTAANRVNALMVDFFTAWSGRRTVSEESGK